MIRTGSFAIAALACLAVSGCLGGCAQNTETPTINDQRQPQALAADQAQQGVNVRNTWNVINYPAGVSSGEPSLVSSNGDVQADLSGAAASPGAAGLARARAGFQTQNGLSWYVVTTGSGTGTQTPTLTGGTLTSSQTPTVTPNQEPTANVTVPIAVGMPGSAPQASAQGQISTGGSTGTQSLTPSQANELRTLLANVKGGVPGALEALTKWSDQVFGKPAPTTQPSP